LAFQARRRSAARNPIGFEELGCGVEVVELVVRLISMGRGSKSIRRWRKDRKRKRRSAKNGSLPPPIKDVAAADNGADNPFRSLPLFLAAQQSRLLPRFGGSATRSLLVWF